MAKPRKSSFSKAIEQVAGRKRDHPAFAGSSFYVPKSTNNAFNKAILALKDAGFDLDRSDILSVLMERFAVLVEQQGPEQNLEEILTEAAAEPALTDLAGVSKLKALLQEEIEQVAAHRQEQSFWQPGDLEAMVASTVQRVLGSSAAAGEPPGAASRWQLRTGPNGEIQQVLHDPSQPGTDLLVVSQTPTPAASPEVQARTSHP
jgi:hypothetical protein